jgi:hypothetical protein
VAYTNFSHLKDEYEDEIQYCRNLKIGDKVKFKSEKQRYTVKAKSDRFIICTKPFNAKKTFLYTVIDTQRLVRGALGLVFGTPYELNRTEEAQVCLNDLVEEKYEVSHRNCIQLDIEI